MELSSLLNKIAVQDARRTSDFRNPNGVYMKVMNFRRFDPAYLLRGKSGLQRGGKLEEEIWKDFSDDPQRLAETANAIRLMVAVGEISSSPDDDESAEAEEGRILTVVHRKRERSRELVNKKKQWALKHNGSLKCEGCSFDFEARYGEHGKGFIEVHHTKPLFTLKPGEKTKLDDLALICANCHRIIHARQPWLSMDQLRQIVR